MFDQLFEVITKFEITSGAIKIVTHVYNFFLLKFMYNKQILFDLQ